MLAQQYEKTNVRARRFRLCLRLSNDNSFVFGFVFVLTLSVFRSFTLIGLRLSSDSNFFVFVVLPLR